VTRPERQHVIDLVQQVMALDIAMQLMVRGHTGALSGSPLFEAIGAMAEVKWTAQQLARAAQRYAADEDAALVLSGQMTEER
jgi:hypothetical protein